MIKEYRTIQEVAGPLMLARDVENVSFDELGEIELPNGEIRRCKVLEVDGQNALVQLFESSAYPWICWAECSTAWAIPRTAARKSWRKNIWISTASR